MFISYLVCPLLLLLSCLIIDWVAQNYPRPRTNVVDWLHKAIDRNVNQY